MRLPGTDSSTGVIGSLRALGDNLLASVHDRVELLSLEMQEETSRVVRSVIWSMAAIVMAALAVAFIAFGLVCLFWEYAVAILAGMALLFGAGAVVTVVSVRRLGSPQPRPFANTLAELEEDRASLRKQL